MAKLWADNLWAPGLWASGLWSEADNTVPVILTTAFADGYVNQPYSRATIALGAPAPTFSLFAGTLPTGLTLGSNGIVSGTPTLEETQAGVQIRATNSEGTDTRTYTFVIRAATVGRRLSGLGTSDVAGVGGALIGEASVGNQ